MYNANVKLIDDKQVRYTVRVCADTLHQAEIYLTRLLSVRYDSRLIWLHYEQDLTYGLYDFTRKLGTIDIVLGD